MFREGPSSWELLTVRAQPSRARIIERLNRQGDTPAVNLQPIKEVR
jgi:hypothetical protein